jgi:hypothetical protein
MTSQRLMMVLAQLGGIASRPDLTEHASRRVIARAVKSGDIVRVGHGRYALPGLDDARAAATRLRAVASHRSAALGHGWAVRANPPHPELIVPTNRNVDPSRRRGVDVRWRDVEPHDVIDGWITGALRTVVDCARDLPLTEALSVADSALRVGDVTNEEIQGTIASLPRFGSKQARVVLEAASALPANPFESSLRALTLEAVGALFEPQPTIVLPNGVEVHPDLGCRPLRIVLEADSHEFHTSRTQIRRDCWRYNEYVLADWLPLRFAWDHVMHEEAWVRDVVVRGVERRRREFAA